MLCSMTGFGAAAGQADGVEYAVEVRSVNNRYFKGSIRLPESLSPLESEIDKRLRSKVTRGTVTLQVRMKVPEELAAATVNGKALQRYLDQLKPLEIDGGPVLRIDLGSLLLLPGVCEPAPLDDLVERTRAGVMALIDQAVDGMLAMRKAEGEALRADLSGHCDRIERHLADVERRSPSVVQEYHERLKGRVAELVNAAQVPVEGEHLAREVAVFAERCDISEEVSRLRGHLEQFREALGLPGAVGRKLDFIAQEMLREANTIASKANDAAIGRAVVEIKTAVDRIKEQVQNAE